MNRLVHESHQLTLGVELITAQTVPDGDTDNLKTELSGRGFKLHWFGRNALDRRSMSSAWLQLPETFRHVLFRAQREVVRQFARELLDDVGRPHSDPEDTPPSLREGISERVTVVNAGLL
jgi:hypothetical protein